jgi:hypothetical protein
MNRRPGVAGAALVVIAVCSASCSGYISKDSSPGGSSAPGAGGSSPSGGGGAAPTPDAPNVPGPAPLRRLTIAEYDRTVRDLLGDTSGAGREFAIDQDAGGFRAGGPVSTALDASRLLEAADSLASGAAARLQTLLPCPTVPTDLGAQSDCARQFIVQFGRRAFRRPLGPDEVNDLLAVYTAHRGPAIGSAFPEAIKAVLSAMLVSPNFLYHLELGTAPPLRDGGVLRFNAHEMASRLSYSLWGTMPDDQLFREADAGRLLTPEQLEQQARRMLKDPRAAEAIADFHLQWLDIDGLPDAPPKDARFKDYTPALVQAMLDETSAFAREIMTSSGSLATLLTGTSTTVDPALARLYGVAVTGTGPQRVTLDATQRAGILTQASFLAMHAETGESHPVKRGATVLRRLLCIEVEQPPNLNVPQPQQPAPGLTTRERFAMHAMNPCATCHQLTDPIGFAFESYDAVGAYRTTDQGKPVDASGTLVLPSGEIRFKDAVELVHAFAGNKDVEACVATQWLRYLLRRSELRGDQSSLQAATDAFRRSSDDVRELLVALVKTRAFTHRTPSAGEVLP